MREAAQTLALQGVEGGVLIPVKVRPRSRANRIEGVREGALIICVTAPPEDGKANAAVIEVLSKTLGCAKSTLSLERGVKSREKRFLAQNVAVETVENKLSAFSVASK